MLKRLWLDNPLIRSMLFYPRRAIPGSSHLADTYDGVVPIGKVKIGYRLYAKHDAEALLLCFHGNGEVVSDYDIMASFFREINLALLVAEYRGYGWSTGQPRTSSLLSDAEVTLQHLTAILARHNTSMLPLFVHGRSLGGAAAIHLAHKFPEQFKGLILESTFAHAPSIVSRVFKRLPGLFDNSRKIGQIRLPLLVIHGERDTLIPIRQGLSLYDTSPSSNKTLLRVPNAGHNDLVAVAKARYFSAINQFVGLHIKE
jgi:fermentation-respiration switch protein FrsA (DUF1100 family)